MHYSHRRFSFAQHTLHRIDFDSQTLSAADLLWLPHHAELAHAGRKRQAEHLAGRIAAAHALREIGLNAVPAIAPGRQPVWPDGVFGSISHSGQSAIAVVAQHPVGIDIESVFTPDLCDELTDSIVTPAEHAVLAACGLPFSLALTLAFCAKESVYKAFSPLDLRFPGFTSAQITALNAQHLTLRFLAEFSPQLADQSAIVYWTSGHKDVVTLAFGS